MWAPYIARDSLSPVELIIHHIAVVQIMNTEAHVRPRISFRIIVRLWLISQRLKGLIL
jgi:hypothetical protein